MIPPQAIDLEQAVLGAALLEKEGVEAVLEHLNEGSFYKPAHEPQPILPNIV